MKYCYFLLLAFLASHASAQPKPQFYFSDPALSPDGSQIAFVSGGDIWTVPAAGGVARLLVSNPAMESRPLYSADGKFLAFTSTRTGNGDIYTINLLTNELKRLTYDDAADDINAWSRDGDYIYFASSGRDISGMRDVYRVRAAGGTPMLVSDTRYMSEFFPTPSPDGKTIAFTARGVGSTQWWRNGASHLDQSEIWTVDANNSYKRITDGGAREYWPMWSSNGKTLYFISDKSGSQNIWEHPLNGTERQLTSFTSGRLIFPSLSYNDAAIVFEKDFGVWKYDLNSKTATRVPITLLGGPATPATEHVRLNNGFSDLAVSPDAKKVAFLAHGDLFVASAKDAGDAMRITSTTAMESSPVWNQGSNALYYVSSRNGEAQLFQYNFSTGEESSLTKGGDDGSLLLSPDGKKLAFIRNGKELHVLDLATKTDLRVTTANLGRVPFPTNGTVSWSPDGKWLAFAAFGAKALRNVYIVPANGGEARQASFLANTFGGNVIWSRDGKSILFTTSQRTENGQVARIDLVPRQPRFREDQFRDLFTNPVAPQEARPVKSGMIDSLSRDPQKENFKGIVWEGIRDRLSLLPLGVDVDDISLTKDGNTLLVTASIAGQTNLYSYSVEELPKETPVLRQLTFSPGFKSDVQATTDGKEYYFIENGRVQSVSAESKVVRPLALTAEMDVDFNAEKMEVFRQAWEIENKGFYDEKFNGVDWNAVKKQYEPLAAGAQTPAELRRILGLMVGELNASHSGVGSSAPGAVAAGCAGIRFNRQAYEKDGRLVVSEIIKYGPADLSGNVSVGDAIIEVDGTPVTDNTNFDQLMENKINRRVVLTLQRGRDRVEGVVVKPVSQQVEKALLYKQWVSTNRDYVAKISNGRLGYVHMFDMGQGSLDQLYFDMDAENMSREGVVVDIRNNNGGFVNAYALDVLSRKGYMTMTIRGMPSAPARTQLGQRALDAPTVLVTNQHSLSDAEDFTEGYRALGLGKVVGEPTAGWIIYTSNLTLFDGTSIRLPFIKITDNSGKNMEMAPRPVDIPVSNPIGEKTHDAQLDAAVKELLHQLDSKK